MHLPKTSQASQDSMERLTQKCFQLLQQSNYQKMVATCTDAVNAARDVGDRQGETHVLINLTSAYGSMGQYEKAIDQAQAALQLAQTLADRQTETYSLINLANLHRLATHYPAAIEYSHQAQQLAQSLGDRQSEAYALINLASTYGSQQNYDQVIDSSQRSLHLAQALGDQPGETGSLVNLASAYEALQHYETAMHYAKQALDLSQKTGYRRGQALALSNLGYARFGQNQLAEAELALRQAIDIFESLRPTLPDTEKLALFETLIDPYHTLQNVLVAQGKPGEALEIAEQSRARALVDRLAQRGSQTQPTTLATAAAPITLADIQQVARTQQATLVEYALVKPRPQGTRNSADRLYLWVVSPAGQLTFRQVDLTTLDRSLGALVDATQTSLAHSSHHAHGLIHAPAAAKNLASENLKQLYQLLIAPIADLLPTNPNSHVIFVPQGSLFLVPFAALQAPDGSYLIEHHTLRTTPSIQVLRLIHQQHQPSRPIQQALVIGNPTRDLPAAEQEAKAIARLFKTTPLLRQQAHKASVVEQMPQADLIHIAAHAAPNPVNDTYGGLIVLADPTTGFSNLTSQDILSLPLRAQLVVLSGCSTGVSDLITSDGVLGLARALMTAGVPSVVMSLWRVHDAPTANLMQAFYQHWQPTGSAPPSFWPVLLPLGL
ncbi:MAG: CHAT domain-containing protein [Leptolyngbyaceae cyanobacterium SM2_5_2]|nr:CHAT domain-containing protein [Leptolyngbyaceae cyanobacterium SM2_5_2]